MCTTLLPTSFADIPSSLLLVLMCSSPASSPLQVLREFNEVFNALYTRQFVSEYLGDLWNWFDWFNVFGYTTFVLRYWFNTVGPAVFEPAIIGDCWAMTVGWVEGYVHSRVLNSYSLQLAFLLAMTFWRTLKYLQISPALMVPFKALINGGREVNEW